MNPDAETSRPDPAKGRSPVVEAALTAAIILSKVATIACAIDAFRNHRSPRLRGKAIRTRAIGYAGGLLIVPLVWRLLPGRAQNPRALDLAVTVPLRSQARAATSTSEATADERIFVQPLDKA